MVALPSSYRNGRSHPIRKVGKPAETGCLATASDDMLVVASKLAGAVTEEKGIPWKID